MSSDRAAAGGSGGGGGGGVCWWCCMRVLEKCLPRNDIVRELAPYLQHVHRDDAADDDTRSHFGASTDLQRVRTPRGGEFVAYEEGQSITSSGSQRHPPMLHSGSIEQLDAVDELVRSRAEEANAAAAGAAGPARSGVIGQSGKSARALGGLMQQAPSPAHARAVAGAAHASQLTQHQSQQTMNTHTLHHHDSGGPRSAPAVFADANASGRDLIGAPLQKKSSLPKIKTDLGDIVPVRWEKVVIVQVSVHGFREMMVMSKDLMEEAKLLYEHTVLSRLSTEYGGQEVLSHPRSGLFVIAFASEFHAAKWCLSLQLSLVYAAWNDKLLKQFDDMKEEYVRQGGKSKKNILLYRGFRVRMVIHTADPEVPPEKSLADAVKWTNTVSEFAHGGQIVLSDSVWDRLKEQLVQLGNPVVEDLGCHSVLKEEVMLMLLLPRDLECRRFPTLKSPFQLSPGMRDAPSAQKPLTMVFTFIEGARPLVRCHAEELAERIKTLCMVARELLRKHNGYECQELQGDFMLAFFNPVCAVLWCSEFQLRIRKKFREWNRESEEQELMFSMSMGIETGIPASVSPHKTSGRADYFGNIVNQTARIAKAAHGGQILIGGDAWNAFNSCPHRSTAVKGSDPLDRVDGSTVVMFKFHGYHGFKGISLPIALIESIPVETPISRGENIRILLSQTRAPKSKTADEALKKTTIAPVPSEMLRLHHGAEREKDTIRETELGSELGFEVSSWDENIPIVEEHGSFDEDSDMPSPMVSGSATLARSHQRLNHSGLMHILSRSSTSFNSASTTSPRAAKSEHMDRV